MTKCDISTCNNPVTWAIDATDFEFWRDKFYNKIYRPGDIRVHQLKQVCDEHFERIKEVIEEIEEEEEGLRIPEWE